jgi:WD40 repeat protein
MKSEIATQNQQAFRTLYRAIALSEGQFSLVLVRCHYRCLQKRILERLETALSRRHADGSQQGRSPGYQILSLEPNATNLYAQVQASTSTTSPQALMVLGLASVRFVDQLLVSTNQVRDEFRDRLSFPLVLWVTDEVCHKLTRLAPDLASWAAPPIKFELDTHDCQRLVRQKARQSFQNIYRATPSELASPPSLAPSVSDLLELHYALQDLQRRHQTVSESTQAEVAFAFAQGDAYGIATNVTAETEGCSSERAMKRYQQSLEFWKSAVLQVGKEISAQFGSPQAAVRQSGDGYPQQLQRQVKQYLLRQAIVLYAMGLALCRQGERQSDPQEQFQQARRYLVQAVQVAELIEQPQLAAKLVTQLAEVLYYLQLWQPLLKITKQALTWHTQYGAATEKARDFGYLAEASYHLGRYKDAYLWSQLAVRTLASTYERPSHKTCENNVRPLFPSLLAIQYRLLWLRVQNYGEDPTITWNQGVVAEDLEVAIAACNPHHHPHRYIRLLEILRSQYYRRGNYPEAFRLKQEQHLVESRYGFRAFVGAQCLRPVVAGDGDGSRGKIQELTPIVPEITASGRMADVKQILSRLARADCKLTVVYGPSGVGKSSLILAGLLPALQYTTIDGQIPLPVVISSYENWVETLGNLLVAYRQPQPEKNSTSSPINSIAQICQQLYTNTEKNLFTILIFDQFEEFFAGSTLDQRREFYEFFSQCLNLPAVKPIFVLREDTIHYLLEIEKYANLEAIPHGNILDAQVRYYLGNFSVAGTRSLLQGLTANHHNETTTASKQPYTLEPELIEQLVEDLAEESGEIRPIELQIVGSQLQAENITILADYQKSGGKHSLIERFLEGVIQDCGTEHNHTARLVLFLLTDEVGNRIVKTRQELHAELAANTEALDFILHVFVESGIVTILPSQTAVYRYQLVHDYLATLIRQREQANLRSELEELRQKQQQNYQEVEQLKEEKSLLASLADARYQLVQETLEDFLPNATENTSLLESLTQLRQREELSQILIDQLRQEKNLLSQLVETKNKQKKVEKDRRRWRRISVTGSAIAGGLLALTTVSALSERQEAEIAQKRAEVAEIEARNAASRALFVSGDRLHALLDSVQAAQKLQATPASPALKLETFDRLQQAATTVREVNRLQGHRDGIYQVHFSPDGELIASASADQTIKLWHRDGRLLQTLGGHTRRASSIDFSPDGEKLASASWDGTVKLWSSSGDLLHTMTAHTKRVLGVAFSPDGEVLASVGSDGKINLWNGQGRYLRTIDGHRQPITSVAFHPNSKIFATASTDRTVKLWSRQEGFIRTLGEGEQGHQGGIYDITFSQDGNFLVSASADRTVKIWRPSGELVRTFQGHQALVHDVAIDSHSNAIASASLDGTIKIWHREGKLLQTLTGHQDWVLGVSFSPDGQWLVSGSRDSTAKIWRWQPQKKLMQTMPAHGGSAKAVAFHPNGNLWASAGDNGKIKLWNAQTEVQATLSAHQGAVTGLDFHSNGKWLVSAGNDGTVKLWRSDGTLVRSWSANQGQVADVAFSPTGDWLVSAAGEELALEKNDVKSDRYSLKLWNLEGKLLQTLSSHQDAVTSVSVSPNGQMLVSGSRDNTVKLWHADGKLLNTFQGHSDWVLDVAFHANGKMVASASADRTARLWNLEGRQLQAFFHSRSKFHSAANGSEFAASSRDVQVSAVTFLPGIAGVSGNTILASASEDGTVKFWRPDVTGESDKVGYVEDGTTPVRTLVSSPSDIRQMAISRDGNQLVAAKGDGTLVVWNLDVDLADLLEVGCNWLQDYVRSHSQLSAKEKHLYSCRQSKK